MPGAFGLCEDHCHTRLAHDLIVEANRRLDIWHLLQCGALVDNAETWLEWDTVACPSGPCEARIRRAAPNLWINAKRVTIVWDEPMPGVGRPWFQCDCGRRARYLYLRDTIGCARCHGLENASDHFRRQTRGVGRVERLRRKLGDCELRPFAPLPARRRGRSQACHDRLVAMIHNEEEKLLDHLGGIAHDLKGRIRVRKARHRW